MRGAALGVVAAVLVTAVTTGCSAETTPSPAKKAGGTAVPQDETAGEDKAPAGGGPVGAAGSPCPMPVTFDLAAHWKPKAVETAAVDDEFAGLLERGPVALVCEIDAKPAGNIGFIRVWAGADAGGDTRKALEAFVEAGTERRSKVAYTATGAGTFEATEVTYVVTGELLDEPKPERAFAVATPKGVVVVDLGGLDAEEHEQMLPAYELAKKTLRSS
ncbi:lipoprotein [Streptomyces peucetius]|uniref:Lipoprotein n=1 Tax=Streptomyces peucetius TaxID=1950 RepID=A0ABY6I988_STRPE|nr:lipoprotein [Streptomyces peucetius]UYQ63560.1 lipoprotein [Streptomyces peucetius]